MDNPTLRSTILLGAHGAVVTALLVLSNDHAGQSVSAAYASMAIPSGLGLLFAWHGLTLLGQGAEQMKYEFWIGCSAMIMAFVIHGLIAGTVLFWSTIP